MILSHLFRKIRFDAQTKGEGRAVVVVVVVNAICVCDAPHHRLICDANGEGYETTEHSRLPFGIYHMCACRNQFPKSSEQTEWGWAHIAHVSLFFRCGSILRD